MPCASSWKALYHDQSQLTTIDNQRKCVEISYSSLVAICDIDRNLRDGFLTILTCSIKVRHKNILTKLNWAILFVGDMAPWDRFGVVFCFPQLCFTIHTVIEDKSHVYVSEVKAIQAFVEISATTFWDMAWKYGLAWKYGFQLLLMTCNQSINHSIDT
jgi:hypothetical protein